MDMAFILDTAQRLVAGVPATLMLVIPSLAFGLVCATGLALLRLSGNPLLEIPARIYVFVFRGTPLLIQIYLIYNGLGQFEFVRDSFLWPFLRQAYWCAILALSLNTAAYTSEIIRGGIQSIPWGQIEAGRACGMSRLLIARRIVAPLAIRQGLPAYGNEMILMVKGSALASLITYVEITKIAQTIISRTYQVVEVFVIAGALYLLINFAVTRLVRAAEWRLSPHLRPRP